MDLNVKYIAVIWASCLFLYLILILLKFVYKVCWIPFRIEYVMRSQGIKGPSYKFLHGNTKEILDMQAQSRGRPMDHSSHEIFPRIMPHVYLWVKLYGNKSISFHLFEFRYLYNNFKYFFNSTFVILGRNFLNWYGPQAQLVVTETELIKEIMYNKDGVYPKIELEGYAKKLLGDGLASTKGEKWIKLRKLANGVFHGETLKVSVQVPIYSPFSSMKTQVQIYIDVERWVGCCITL